jgi:hypothetical protein
VGPEVVVLETESSQGAAALFEVSIPIPRYRKSLHSSAIIVDITHKAGTFCT